MWMMQVFGNPLSCERRWLTHVVALFRACHKDFEQPLTWLARVSMWMMQVFGNPLSCERRWLTHVVASFSACHKDFELPFTSIEILCSGSLKVAPMCQWQLMNPKTWLNHILLLVCQTFALSVPTSAFSIPQFNSWALLVFHHFCLSVGTLSFVTLSCCSSGNFVVCQFGTSVCVWNFSFQTFGKHAKIVQESCRLHQLDVQHKLVWWAHPCRGQSVLANKGFLWPSSQCGVNSLGKY